MTTHHAPPPAAPAPRPIERIWIFEDHQCFRELLADYLRTIPGLEITGTVDDEAALGAAIDAGRVDLVILDLHLSGAGGFHVMERIRQRPNPPRVLILSGQATPHSITLAVRLGAVGYLQKTAPLEELIPALQAIRAGGTYFSEGAPRQIWQRLAHDAQPAAATADLSRRELELITRLVHGATAKELAADWQLSRFTIYKSRTQLLRKINARNQRDLVAYALRNGMLDPAQVH